MASQPTFNDAALGAARPQSALLAALGAARVDRWRLGLVALAGLAFALRLAYADQQSAYMDEGTNVLTGRLLIEQHSVYAEVLNWAYGSYLWPLIAGWADMAGGLVAVRTVTAGCGAIMVLATVLAAYRLAPRGIPNTRRRAVALLAGVIAMLAPTAIAVGRFGTYDALAGAGFMLGLALLLPIEERPGPLRLLAAAALFFIAFLAKYLVAIYFPLICLYAMLGPLVWARSPRHTLRSALRTSLRYVLWFVAPLTALCAAYLIIFLGPLLTLFTSSLSYGDLKSATPLNEYVWSRPEIWLLVIAAAFGWRRATGAGRLVALVGAGLIMAFQLQARPDFDFWKHSIYVIYFLAPLAALVALDVPQHTGTWRVVAIGGTAVAIVWLAPRAEVAANQLVDFYPNANPALDALYAHTGGAAEILTDDTSLRYYLYGRMPIDGMIGPFSFLYEGQSGIEAYRRAVVDQYFDTIVLDGGVSPQGAAIRQQLSPEINANYTRVATSDDGHGFRIDVYMPNVSASGRAPRDSSPWPIQYTFESGTGDWGGHPDTGDATPGLQVAASTDQPWNGQPALQFAVGDGVQTVTVRTDGTVSAVRAHVYLVTDGGTQPVRIGMMGFDGDWQWRDDGYRWLVSPGTWTTIRWDLTEPGPFNEVGLNFPKDVRFAYVGDVEINP
ncbi:MAG: hypothetical protein QOF51_12 [Chloroflexota bacterium]|jgi:hypothetical protein|nr:hypothetical protein [Chloroflexota bacterium]